MTENILEPSGAGGLLFVDFTLACCQPNVAINRFYNRCPLPSPWTPPLPSSIYSYVTTVFIFLSRLPITTTVKAQILTSLFPNAQQENLIFYQSLFSHVCSNIFPSIIRWRWSIKSSLLYVKFKVMAGTWSDSQALRIVEAWVKYAQRHLEAGTVLELREGLKKKISNIS